MNELNLLAAITGFTAVMWMPYILDRIYHQGLVATVAYPNGPWEASAWALRAKKAHANAIENLAVFIALVLVADSLDKFDSITLLASQLYLGARVAHFLLYIFAVPWLRTLAFFGGFVAQMLIAWTIFS